MIWLRLVKFLALALFAGGVIGSVVSPSRKTRLKLTLGAAVPGLLLLWEAGWMMAVRSGRGLDDAWILTSMGASAVSLAGVYHLSHEATPWRSAAPAALGGLVAALGLMVLRPEQPWAIAAALGLAGALPGLALHRPTDALDLEGIERGFRWVAWVEGFSLLLMLGVSLPLRLITGIDLDGDTGLIGWTHGVMVVLYMQALWSAGSALGWSWGRMAVGFVASLLPFGAFFFEHRSRLPKK